MLRQIVRFISLQWKFVKQVRQRPGRHHHGKTIFSFIASSYELSVLLLVVARNIIAHNSYFIPKILRFCLNLHCSSSITRLLHCDFTAELALAMSTHSFRLVETGEREF